MNDTKLDFNGLIKLNTERPSFGNEPLLSHVHKTYENGLIFQWATTSVCYPLWSRKNEKEELILRDEEIKRKGNIFSFVSMAAHSPYLNMAHVCIFIFEQLGIQLVSESIHFHDSPNSFDSIQRMCRHIPCITSGFYLVNSMIPSQLSCRNFFKGCLFSNHTHQ